MTNHAPANDSLQARFSIDDQVGRLQFKLIDKKGLPALYVAGKNHQQHMTIELCNKSDAPIELSFLGSSCDCHLALVFKPETFDDIGQVKQAEKFYDSIELSYEENNQHEQIINICIKSDDKKKLNPSDKLHIDLVYPTVLVGFNAFNTDVELRYQTATEQSENPNEYQTLMQATQVIKHIGEKYLPLHVGIVGSNTLLNCLDKDSKENKNKLRIRLTNTSTDKTLFFTESDDNIRLHQHEQAQLQVLFDDPVHDNAEWRLTNLDHIKKIEIEWSYFPSEGEDTKELTIDSETVAPVFNLDLSKIKQLDPGQAFELILTNIVTTAPSGLANIYIKYHNIPGYWDGQFVVQAEKTPIVHSYIEAKSKEVQQKKEEESKDAHRNVGIGIFPNNDYRLTVSGDLYTSGKIKATESIECKDTKAHAGYFNNNSDANETLRVTSEGTKAAAIFENNTYKSPCMIVKNYIRNSEAKPLLSIESPSNGSSFTALDTKGVLAASGIKLGGDEAAVINTIVDQVVDKLADEAKSSVPSVFALNNLVPVGTIMAYAGEEKTLNSDNWKICDGRKLSRSDYPVLAKVLGYDSSNDFSLPDCRGYFIRGCDNRGNVALGDPERRGIGSKQENALSSHYHEFSHDIYAHYRTFEGSGGNDADVLKAGAGSGGRLYDSKTRSQKNGASETRPKNIAFHYIIRVK